MPYLSARARISRVIWISLLVLLVHARDFGLEGGVFWQTIEVEGLFCRENNRALGKVAIVGVVERVLNKVADEHLHTGWRFSPLCKLLRCDAWVIVLIVLAVLITLPVELGCVEIVSFLIPVFLRRSRIRTSDERNDASSSRSYESPGREGRERKTRHCFIYCFVSLVPPPPPLRLPSRSRCPTLAHSCSPHPSYHASLRRRTRSSSGGRTFLSASHSHLPTTFMAIRTTTNKPHHASLLLMSLLRR